ncbi:FHA domain-containing protein [Friedmanniella luteola]|uniref:FHA domain-containing protein n=1 Tax=Friedmanniella luteola TaxID=546871 RepID=A0A1H1ZW55_9ACTN|nr:FHA domain-containing protein [Friedmanniella luteola]SDT37797.1 FHA domain-containing protein [Friedmanniella luteola]
MRAVGAWRATYTPGDWLVLSGPTSLVVVEPPGEGWTPLVEELWQQVLASSSLVDLARRLAGYGLDTMPSFGALFWTAEHGMRSLVRGAVTVVDPADGRVVASGEGIQTWSEVGLGQLGAVLVRTDEGGPAGPEVLRLPLVVGAVRASAVLLDARAGALVGSPQLDDEREHGGDRERGESPVHGQGREGGEDPAGPERVEPTSRTRAAQEARADEAETVPEDLEALPAGVEPTQVLPDRRPPGPAAPPAAVDPARAALENADTELVQLPPAAVDRDPASPEVPPAGPTVRAVLCPHGHPNPPGELRCRDCGVTVSDQRVRVVAQPVLAVLRASDGTEAAVDRTVLVGRAPAGRGSGPVRLLTVPSPAHDISRTHLEVAVEGWQVTVTDLHSTNGTMLLDPAGGRRRTLPPGQAVPVLAGYVLELAEGVSVTVTDPR